MHNVNGMNLKMEYRPEANYYVFNDTAEQVTLTVFPKAFGNDETVYVSVGNTPLVFRLHPTDDTYIQLLQLTHEAVK